MCAVGHTHKINETTVYKWSVKTGPKRVGYLELTDKDWAMTAVLKNTQEKVSTGMKRAFKVRQNH